MQRKNISECHQREEHRLMEEEKAWEVCVCMAVLLPTLTALTTTALTTTSVCWGQGQGDSVSNTVRKNRHPFSGTTMNLPKTSGTATTGHQLREDGINSIF